jgi:hypothetical protein
LLVLAQQQSNNNPIIQPTNQDMAVHHRLTFFLCLATATAFAPRYPTGFRGGSSRFVGVGSFRYDDRGGKNASGRSFSHYIMLFIAAHRQL